MTLLQNGVASSVITLIVLIAIAWLWMQFHSFWAIVLVGWALGVMSVRMWAAAKRWWQAVD